MLLLCGDEDEARDDEQLGWTGLSSLWGQAWSNH